MQAQQHEAGVGAYRLIYVRISKIRAVLGIRQRATQVVITGTAYPIPADGPKYRCG